MNKSLILLYTNASTRGPGKVVKNLEKGLRDFGITFGDENILRDNIDANVGILQYVKDWKSWTKKAVVGPNVFVIPSEMKEMCSYFNNFVVPSEWVKNLYREFSELDHAQINVWSVGIDTESWGEIQRETSSLRCLLYYKNRSETDLKVVKNLLSKFKINVKEIHYGSYSEEHFRQSLNWANFGVCLTDTESQGLAYMEMLSTNLPLFVFNKPTWNYGGNYKKVSASSVPYFDYRCGIISDNINLIMFEEFLHSVEKDIFRPREYILESHTIKQSTKKYLSFFTEK